jgi:hypothetical protein
MDLMSIDLFCATSDRVPESGPVLSGLFRTGGPSEGVQLHQSGMHRAVFEVDRYCLQDILAKFFPRLCFGEDAMAKSPRTIATFLSVANLEDQLHAHRIPEAGMV